MIRLDNKILKHKSKTLQFYDSGWYIDLNDTIDIKW